MPVESAAAVPLVSSSFHQLTGPGGGGGVTTPIHSASVSTKLVSTTFLASDGIWMLPTLVARRYMIEWDRSCGTTILALAIPSASTTGPFTMRWSLSTVSKSEEHTSELQSRQ